MKISSRPVIIASVSILLLVSTLTIFAFTQAEPASASRATAKAGLKTYLNSACTQQVSSISWGNLKPGSSIVKTVYIKNTGSTALTLHLLKTNWSPTTANGPISITWNRENFVLYPNRVTTAKLTLTVSQSIQGISTFSVDVLIRGVSR